MAIRYRRPLRCFRISTVRMDGHSVVHGPGVTPPAPVRPVVAYRSDRRCWARGMDGWALAHLIDLGLRGGPEALADGLVVTVSEEEFQRLPGDVRMHFKPVRE